MTRSRTKTTIPSRKERPPAKKDCKKPRVFLEKVPALSFTPFTSNPEECEKFSALIKKFFREDILKTLL